MSVVFRKLIIEFARTVVAVEHSMPAVEVAMRTVLWTIIGLGVLFFVTDEAAAQKGAAPMGQHVQIPDEPKTVDPATLVPEKLARPVTVDFADKSLKDILTWIQTEQKIEVLLDQKALAEESILASEQVSDRLQAYPLYLLLNRLSTLGLAWYMEAGNLHITTTKVAARHLTTAPYNVGDLFDAGFKQDDLTRTIREATSGPWSEDNKTGGGIVLLGDVLFVRQTGPMHREVAGLLAAFRKHGRQTFSLDPPQHAILRQKLEQNVTVKFQELPLSDAVQELSRLAAIDIRLDRPALMGVGVRDRQPVSLELADQKLTTVLQALLTDHNLTWVLRDGVLWITSQQYADAFRKTAIFNVGDLCRDSNESAALMAAIHSQTQGPWSPQHAGGGTISFARPDVMVLRQTERGLAEVLQLLENYRTALRNSKPRQREGQDPQEVITRYYRLPNEIAEQLQELLKELIQPASWKSDKQPQAVGTIRKLASKSTLVGGDGYLIVGTLGETDREPGSRALVVRNSVLIITQTRAIHGEIAELLERIQEGDAETEAVGGAMGGGMGGFGGGLFSLPDSPRERRKLP